MTLLKQFSRVDTSKPAWLMAMRIIARGGLEPNAVSFSFALCDVAKAKARFPADRLRGAPAGEHKRSETDLYAL
jgi:hypothetical protein